MKKALILLWLFSFGGSLYIAIEMLWRGHSHPAMYFVGGVCFVLIGLVNESILTFNMSILFQCLIASAIVLVVEFASGVILNLILGLQIWDYSNLPLNLFGQICLCFAGAWYVLSAVGIILDDFLRYWLFGEEKPKYRF